MTKTLFTGLIPGEVEMKEADYEDPYLISGASSLKAGDFIYIDKSKSTRLQITEEILPRIVKIEKNDVAKDTLYCRIVASSQDPRFKIEDVDYSSFHLFVLSISTYAKYTQWQSKWTYLNSVARDYMDEYVLNPIYAPDNFIFVKNLKHNNKHLFKVVTLRGELALVEDHGGFLDSGELLSLGTKRWIHLPSFYVSQATEESILEVARAGKVSVNIMGHLGVSTDSLKEKLISTSKEAHNKFVKSVATDTAALVGVGLGVAAAFKLAGSVVRSLVPPQSIADLDEMRVNSNQLEEPNMSAKGRTITHLHSFSREELTEKIAHLLEDLTTKFPDYLKNLKVVESEDPTVVYMSTFDSDVVTGSVLVTTSKIEVNFDMKGFLYKAFAGVAESKIREIIEKDFSTKTA